MKKQRVLRYSILLAFLGLFTYTSIRHFVLGGGIAPSVDALCPFGGFESLFTFISTGSFILRITMSSFVLALAIVIISLIFSRGFCGWICPFGTIQELLSKITKNKLKIPKNIENKSIYSKYVILFVILIGTAITGTLVFRGFDPFMGFFHFGKGVLWAYSADEFVSHSIPFFLAIIVVTTSIFITRFWCRFFCPLGALTSLFAKIGLTKLVRNKKTCVNCKICDKVCPTKVKVSDSTKIKGGECISCNECIEACPKNSLSNNIGKYKIPYFGILIVGVLILIIVGAYAIGFYETLPSDEVACGDANEIKGYMSLLEVSTKYNVDLKEMIKDLKLPENIDTSLPINEIGAKYGFLFHTTAVRNYILEKKVNQSLKLS